ncbi:hypothetical protein L6452_17580 [Arctium lappa]|uniref:Uncharacterized protein n=1 Tax=Arctium lappa TaxID=4217 RepID=A0ACB9C3X6_ARCLA|nr:hypothetical protein L6452_17580 [Arctium lappa]
MREGFEEGSRMYCKALGIFLKEQTRVNFMVPTSDVAKMEFLKHFHAVLQVVLRLSADIIKPNATYNEDVPVHILTNPRYYPMFKDCIGAIDGTHVRASVREHEQAKYIGRKGYATQNIMAVCLAIEPLLPLLSAYRSIPYASYLAFLLLYIGVVRNTNVSRYARFNAMQAVILDVLLVIPLLVQRIFNPGPHGIGGKMVMMSHNAIFVFVVACFVYSTVFSVLGRTPKLPFVADAAGRQF